MANFPSFQSWTNVDTNITREQAEEIMKAASTGAGKLGIKAKKLKVWVDDDKNKDLIAAILEAKG